MECGGYDFRLERRAEAKKGPPKVLRYSYIHVQESLMAGGSPVSGGTEKLLEDTDV